MKMLEITHGAIYMEHNPPRTRVGNVSGQPRNRFSLHVGRHRPSGADRGRDRPPGHAVAALQEECAADTVERDDSSLRFRHDLLGHDDAVAVGNAAFHYDESLGNFGGSNPYRVSKWKELTTAADRAAYASVLSW